MPGMTDEARADNVSAAELCGARLNANWCRYINGRYGTAADIPAKGYRYRQTDNGAGVWITSANESIVISVLGHHTSTISEDATEDVKKSISRQFDAAVSYQQKNGGTITYSVKRDDFYVISGTVGAKFSMKGKQSRPHALRPVAS
jgi:hypothetical protein